MINRIDVNEMNVNNMVKKHGNTIYKIALAYTRSKADAEDVYQDVFIRYFRKKQSFENENHEKAWFIRTTINCCKSLLRSSWLKHTVLFDKLGDDFYIPEESSNLFYAVMALPLKYREVIHLYYYEGYTAREIASFLNRTETAVTTQLMRGRDLLRNIVKEELEYE